MTLEQIQEHLAQGGEVYDGQGDKVLKIESEPFGTFFCNLQLSDGSIGRRQYFKIEIERDFRIVGTAEMVEAQNWTPEKVDAFNKFEPESDQFKEDGFWISETITPYLLGCMSELEKYGFADRDGKKIGFFKDGDTPTTESMPTYDFWDRENWLAHAKAIYDRANISYLVYIQEDTKRFAVKKVDPENVMEQWPLSFATESEAQSLANRLNAVLNGSEPKQGVWEVGAKVRVTDNKHDHRFEIGQVVEIEEHDADASPAWRCSDGEDYWWLSEDEGEIVEP